MATWVTLCAVPGAAVTLAPSWLMASAHAQDAPRTVYFFNMSLGSGPQIKPAARYGPWGGGEVQPTRQLVDYLGGAPLEITTRGFAEGARFDLERPVDIAPYVPGGFIRLRVRFAPSVVQGGATEGFVNVPDVPEMSPNFGEEGGRGRRGRVRGQDQGGGQGGFDRNQANFQMRPPTDQPTWNADAQFGRGGALPPIGGGVPGQGFPGGFEGGFPGGLPGVPGSEGVLAGPPPQTTNIKQIRVTLVRERGTMMGRFDVDLNAIQPDAEGWRLLTLPVRELSSTPEASGPIKRVLLTADAVDTFFLAEAALVVDTGQISVSVRRPDQPVGASLGEITVKPGPLTLVADVEAGAADPVVEWNFDADNTGTLPPPGGAGGTQGGFPGAINPETGAPIGGFPGGFPGGGIPGGGIPGGGIPGGGIPGGGIPGGAPGAVDPETGAPIGEGFTGPRIDARGLSATFDYPAEEQNYRVEVTVRDRSGKKQPTTASVLVRVRG